MINRFYNNVRTRVWNARTLAVTRWSLPQNPFQKPLESDLVLYLHSGYKAVKSVRRAALGERPEEASRARLLRAGTYPAYTQCIRICSGSAQRKAHISRTCAVHNVYIQDVPNACGIYPGPIQCKGYMSSRYPVRTVWVHGATST